MLHFTAIEDYTRTNNMYRTNRFLPVYRCSGGLDVKLWALQLFCASVLLDLFSNAIV